MEFLWNDWNLEHATRHGVSPVEAESLVRRGPCRHVGDNKYRVYGRGTGGRFIQVIYVLYQSGLVYIIHARPLTESENDDFEGAIDDKTEKQKIQMVRLLES